MAAIAEKEVVCSDRVLESESSIKQALDENLILFIRFLLTFQKLFNKLERKSESL